MCVCGFLGDVEHKPYVSNDAEVTSVQLDDSCDFLVLGCDGLFDLLSYQDVVVNAYHSALTRRFDTSVAENLTRAAILKGKRWVFLFRRDCFSVIHSVSETAGQSGGKFRLYSYVRSFIRTDSKKHPRCRQSGKVQMRKFFRLL